MPLTLVDTNNISSLKSTMPTPIEWVEKGKAVKQDFEDYKTTLDKTMELNLRIIDELPEFSMFTKEQIRNHLTKILEEQLKKSEVLEKSVQMKKYCHGINKYLQSYFAEIYKYHDRIRDDAMREMHTTCKDFFNSDLPLSFLKTIESECLCVSDYLDIYDKRLKEEHFKLIQNLHNERKFKNLLNEHNQWIDPFTERLDRMEHARVKLMWYIDLCNCSKIDDFDKSKPIRVNNLNIQYFNSLTREIEELVSKTSALIRPYIEFHPLSSYEDASAMVIRNVMDLL